MPLMARGQKMVLVTDVEPTLPEQRQLPPVPKPGSCEEERPQFLMLARMFVPRSICLPRLRHMRADLDTKSKG